MEFTIKGPLAAYSDKISIRNPIVLIGSCFSENIGKLLQEIGFDTTVNPFGIVYNPLSIAEQLNSLSDKKIISQAAIYEYQGNYLSWKHHSRFNSPSVKEIWNQISYEFEVAYQKITQAEWLFLTLGSAFYYTLKENNELVSNCHKLPASFFNKNLASQKQIHEHLTHAIIKLKQLNPKLKIMLNVSPIRYIKEGLHHNTISKSTLHLAVSQIITELNGVYYFPSYEIVIDQLRDYRFYKPDMTHPNETAINFIFDFFSETLFDSETKLIIKETQKYIQFCRHKPLSKNLADIRKIDEKKEEMYLNLLQKYPFLTALKRPDRHNALS